MSNITNQIVLRIKVEVVLVSEVEVTGAASRDQAVKEAIRVCRMAGDVVSYEVLEEDIDGGE